MYFIDNQRNVIGLLKKKTIWYIICRAIREKVRNAFNSKAEYVSAEVNRKVS